MLVQSLRPCVPAGIPSRREGDRNVEIENVDMCVAAQEYGACPDMPGGAVCIADMIETHALSFAVAAAEGRVLAVSFLLGISADPNTLDRWRGSPMDDALQGGTVYHMYCAKLLQAWGGVLVRYHDSAEGVKFMKEVHEMSIKSVRLLISKLIGQGLDRKKPHRLGEQAALVVMGACARHMEIVVRLKKRVAAITAEMSVLTQSIDRCTMEVQSHVESMLKVLEIQSRISSVPENNTFELKDSRKRPHTARRSQDRTTIVHDTFTALDLDLCNRDSLQVPKRHILSQEATFELDHKGTMPMQPNIPIRRSQSVRTTAASLEQQERVNTKTFSHSMVRGSMPLDKTSGTAKKGFVSTHGRRESALLQQRSVSVWYYDHATWSNVD